MSLSSSIISTTCFTIPACFPSILYQLNTPNFTTFPSSLRILKLNFSWACAIKRANVMLFKIRLSIRHLHRLNFCGPCSAWHSHCCRPLHRSCSPLPWSCMNTSSCWGCVWERHAPTTSSVLALTGPPPHLRIRRGSLHSVKWSRTSRLCSSGGGPGCISRCWSSCNIRGLHWSGRWPLRSHRRCCRTMKNRRRCPSSC